MCQVSIQQILKKTLAFPLRVIIVATAAGVTVPFIVCIIIFLISYNNILNGELVLTLVFTSAILLWMLPMFWSPPHVNVAALRLTSLYIAVIFGSWLFMELIFPHAFPKEYVHLMEITKVIRGHDLVPPACVNEIFENEDQHVNVIKRGYVADKTGKISWHRPGERFQYHGSDPNSGMTYLNRFFWNSRGYFDHDRALVKPPRTKRIVVIGDSYVESVQVPLAKTFHKRMETLLNGQHSLTSADTTFQVIALGNSGTGQSTNLATLRREGLAYQPDLVIFTLCSNDICDDDPYLKSRLILYSGEFEPLTRSLVRHGLMAAAFVVQRVQAVRRSRVAVSPELLQWCDKDLPEVEKAWKRTLGYVHQAKIMCDSSNVAFLLVYLGSEIEVNYALEPAKTLGTLRGMGSVHAAISWDMTRSVKRIQNYCSEHNINFISLLRPLTQAQSQTNKLVFGDHYTAFGHEIVAGVLACAGWKYLFQHPVQRLDECLEEGYWLKMF